MDNVTNHPPDAITLQMVLYGLRAGLVVGLLIILLLTFPSALSKKPSPLRASPGNSQVLVAAANTALNPDRGVDFDIFSSRLGKSAIETDFNLPINKTGLAPVYFQIPTKQPVVFLTIDDGENKNADGLRFMKRHGLVASLFLNDHAVQGNYNYFNELKRHGSIIENHTLSHEILTNLGYEAQKREICDNADKFAKVYGQRPTLFRPPGGFYDYNTRRAAHECGMKAIIMWHAKVNGKSVQYQEGEQLQPGDIVLMHFRDEMLQDLQAFEKAVNKANVQVALLEEWL